MWGKETEAAYVINNFLESIFEEEKARTRESCGVNGEKIYAMLEHY